MLTYAIIGISHPHIETLYRSLASYPDEAVCIGYADSPSYDEQDVNEKIRQNLGVEAAESLTRFDNYRELIAKKPELAVICCDNADCAKIAIECISAGINVALEKPMTESYADAIAICEAAEKAGVKAVVNWPVAEFTAFNKAKELADSGKVGKIMRVVYRSPATWGPYSYSEDGQNPPIEELGKTWWYKRKRGGGSILDYACYGAALSTWFYGKRAESVQTIAKNFCLHGLDVEDYSAMLIDFGDGVGLLEGSWSTYNPAEIPSGPIIYGTEGVIVCDRHSNNTVKLYTGRSHTPIPPTEVFECQKSIEKLKFGRDIIDHLTKAQPIHPLREARFNADVMYILDCGLKTADKTVRNNFEK